MSEPTAPSLLVVELRRWSDTIKDSGIAALAEAWEAETAGLSADLVAEFVALRILAEGPEIAPHKRVLHPRDRVGRSPLLAALHRLRFDLRAGAGDQIFRLWNIELRRLPAPAIAGELMRRLALPENRRFVRTDDPSELALERVYRVLLRFADDLIQTAPSDLAQNWGEELSRYPRASQVVEVVVQRLAGPAFVGYLKPGRVPPKTGEEALRAALRRYPELVPPRLLESTFAAWKPLFSHLPPARVAGLVCEKLGAED